MQKEQEQWKKNFLWTKVDNFYKFLMKGNMLWCFECHTFVLQKISLWFYGILTHPSVTMLFVQCGSDLPLQIYTA